MIDFQKLDPAKRDQYTALLLHSGGGCEYSFVNLCIWGRQQAAFMGQYLTLFSQFDRRAVYPFPVGQGDIRPVLEAMICDARQRGIPCCISGLNEEKKAILEACYPGQFSFHMDRDIFDYVYSIDDLADLKGRKYQKKRNHLNKFRLAYPDWRTEVITPDNLEVVRELSAQWYQQRQAQNPTKNYHLEKLALERAMADMERLGLEGLVLYAQGQAAAFTMGSRLSPDTYDIHFEKALDAFDGAYPAINQAFSAYLRQKHPELKYLNREDDMGLEGLRKAKLSYCPAFLVEKYWARLWEETDEH